jgi:hypothetical protein
MKRAQNRVDHVMILKKILSEALSWAMLHRLTCFKKERLYLFSLRGAMVVPILYREYNQKD